jgi:hypothetical protein
MTKKSYGLIVAAAMVLLPAGTGAAQGFTTIPDGTDGVIISGYTGYAESLAIPAAIDGRPVTGIGERAFFECYRLTAITVSAENRQYRDIGGVLFTRDGKTLHSYPAGRETETYRIPASVVSIGEWAFSGCDGLTSLRIPAGVASIGAGAFSYCEGLTRVRIPASVASVGVGAFSGCGKLNNASRRALAKRFGDRVL